MVPFASLPVAINCSVVPDAIPGAEGVTEIEVRATEPPSCFLPHDVKMINESMSSAVKLKTFFITT